MTRHLSHDSHMTFSQSRHCFEYIKASFTCRSGSFYFSHIQYSKTMEQPESNPTFCTNNCGFYGSPQFEGMCSKCYRDQLNRSYNPELANSCTSTLFVQRRNFQIVILCFLKAITHRIALYKPLRIFFKMKPFLVQLK